MEPPGLWLTRDDVLILRADFESGDFQDVEARVRILSAALTVEDYRLRAHYAVAQPNPQVVQLQAPEGFLQGAVITQLGDYTETAPFTYPTGRVYAQLTVGKGLIPGGYEHTLVCAGYVTGHSSVGYPGGKNENAGDGAGRIQRVALADPGVGVLWSYQPVGVYAEVICGSFVYTTSAAAGNRIIGVRCWDGTSTSYIGLANATQAAGIVGRYNFGQGFPFDNNVLGANPVRSIPWPIGLKMERAAIAGGFVLGGMLAGDAITNVVLNVRTWTI